MQTDHNGSVSANQKNPSAEVTTSEAGIRTNLALAWSGHSCPLKPFQPHKSTANSLSCNILPASRYATIFCGDFARSPRPKRPGINTLGKSRKKLFDYQRVNDNEKVNNLVHAGTRADRLFRFDSLLSHIVRNVRQIAFI